MVKLKEKAKRQIDYRVILPVFLLSVIGMLAYYVALYHNPQQQDGVFEKLLFQGVWYVVGAIAIFIVMQFDSKKLWKITPFAYAVGILLMIALYFFGDSHLAGVTGSQNWFRIGRFSFQPSEVLKIAYLMMLAYVVVLHNTKHRLRTLKSDGQLILKMALVSAPVFVFILEDFGTMLVFVAILGGIFIMSGISWKIVVPVTATFFILCAAIIYLVTTDSGRDFLRLFGAQEYQFARIDSWLDPFHDTSGTSLQQAQSLIAIGSGGMLGKGFNVSEVFVPVRESDMIFTVIGENFGFVGGCVVIFLYFILIYQMIRVCFDTNNEFYSYIATGVIMMILFHVFENIGASIGLMPLTGIPLPFISQGGSALLGNMLGVGLILSMVYHHQPKSTAY